MRAWSDLNSVERQQVTELVRQFDQMGDQIKQGKSNAAFDPRRSAILKQIAGIAKIPWNGGPHLSRHTLPRIRYSGWNATLDWIDSSTIRHAHSDSR